MDACADSEKLQIHAALANSEHAERKFVKLSML
jgi:hypothetical protein